MNRIEKVMNRKKRIRKAMLISLWKFDIGFFNVLKGLYYSAKSDERYYKQFLCEK